MTCSSDPSKRKESFSSEVNIRFHRGLFLHQQGRIHDAKTIYRLILSENPAYAAAWQYLGVIAIGQKQYAEAIAYLERSLQLDSSISEWHNNYGVALREIGRTVDAIREFRTALQKRPDYADAWSNYGYALFLSEGTSRKAYAAIRQALKYFPDHSDAWMHLANMKIHDKQFVEARTILEKLCGLHASSPLFVEKMTHVIAKSESGEAAVRYLTPMIDVFPSHRQELYRYLGCLNGEIGNITEAKALFRETCALRQKNEIWRWKHLAYCPTVFENEDQIQTYWETLHRDLDEAIAEHIRYDRRSLAYEGFCPSFNLPHLGFCCRGVKEKFDHFFADSFPESTFSLHSKKRIRVGFLVTPEHEGGFQRLVLGILKKLDRLRFEPFLFYHEMTASRFGGRLMDDVQIVTFNGNFIQSVQKIRETKCDVIYYWKAGEDIWNQFFAMARLAPIQCTSWGTHGTSGIHNMDYYVSWDMAESVNAQEHYTEKLMLIPTNPNDEPYQRVPPRASRSELGLPTCGAIYFCPHRLPKYQPSFDFYLREILARDSTGHIVLFTDRPSPTVERLKERMRREIGAELSQRLIFLPSQSVPNYYRYLSAATVVLHAPLYSGEITWVDSLFYGVPSVSQTGELLIQRYGTAYSRLFEVPNLAAKDREAYMDEAIRLGTNADYRHDISQRILCQRADFFDNRQTTRAWEDFLEEAVRSNESHRS